jgi:hypothetical protein
MKQTNPLLERRRTVNPKDVIGKRKPLLHLCPPILQVWVSEVFRFSAPKYGPYNWRQQAVTQSVYLDATFRHLLALADGQQYDVESGLPHEAHIAANMAILLDAASMGKIKYDTHEYPAGMTSEIIAALTHYKEENPDGSKATC